MKLVTRVLIMAIAFFVSASVIDAQDKGKGSIGGKDKPKAKQETKSKLKSSTVKAKTVKGKGVSFMETHGPWHHKIPNQIEYKEIMKELKG